ncbi:MAG: hypothetical protein FWF31_06245 [Desulfobulbus sp.]|nr:hypothetical protein [Desulfobulbus sp.]
MLTIGDRVLVEHARYARHYIRMDSGDPEMDNTVADTIGWHSPSAEMEYEARQCGALRN